MPVRMVANRRHYCPFNKKEYESGQWFNVPSDREADRLVRMRRASRDAPKAEQKPPVQTKVMTAEPEATPADTAPANDPPPMRTRLMRSEAPGETPPDNRSNRYRRADLKAED